MIGRHLGRSANLTYSIFSDHRQVFFVISVDPPVKQGNARYPFIICLFDKDQTVDLELEIDEGDLKEKYDNKLQRSMSGATFEVVSRLMKAVTSRKITVPGSYKSDQGIIFVFTPCSNDMMIIFYKILFRKQLHLMQLSCSNWCLIPIGTRIHVSSQGNIYFQVIQS